MNGKKRYIPIIALGALLISLLAILPVAAAGEVSFIVPGDIDGENTGALTDDTPDTQEWARQGGQVGILVDDSDLNASVKRVLLPFVDTEIVGVANLNRNSNVFTIAEDDRVDLDRDTTGDQTVERNDLIMVGYETLRKVTKREFVDTNVPATDTTDDDDVKITVDRAYHLRATGGNRAIHRIKQDYSDTNDDAYDAFDGDGYKTLASGLRVGSNAVTPNYRPTPFDFTEFTLDRDVVDSGVGSHSGVSLEDRLKSAVSRGVRNDDFLMLRLDGLRTSLISDPRLGTDEIDMADADTIASTTGASVAGTRYVITNPTARGTFNATVDGRASGHNISGANVGSVNSPLGDLNAYILFWASEENDTGSSVTVRSQAHQSPVTLALAETTATSGEFAAKINLIPAEVEVPWEDIPTGESAGTVVTVDDQAPTANTDYDGYKVEMPSATRPGTLTDDNRMQKVKTVADFEQVIPRLPVNPRDTISVRHPDDTGTIRVETTPSVFSAFSPAHNSSSRDSRPELSAQVIDGDSGLKDSDIDIIYTVDDGGVLSLDPSDDGYTDAVSGGFTVRARVARVDDETDRVIKWWVKAEDKAGNVTYSDRQPTVDGAADKCTVTTNDDSAVTQSDSKCQPYIITVDNTEPSILRAETGRFWDSSLSTGDSDDKTEYRASKASTTSVLVIFSEHLDAGTVQASDFEVNDATPTSADVFNVKVRNDNPDTGDGNNAIAGDSVQDEGEKRGYVFLSVNAMTSNAKPKVALVDDVEDIAGNRRSTGAISAATDRIGPTLAVSFSGGDRPVTNKDVTLTVTSDEDIGSPDVRYYRVKSTKVADGDSVHLLDTVRTDAVVTFKNAKEYEVKITPPTDGLYTVFVEADDSAGGNAGTIGDETVDIDVASDTTAVLFERDKAIDKPDFDPARTGVNDKYETDDANGFVRIDYSAEASEYYDAGSDAKVCNQQVDPPNCSDSSPNETAVTGDDLDTYGRLTIVSATLDGTDISGDLNPNSDGNIFQYHLDGMAVGEYDLEITVEDEAGNRNAAAHKGTIKIIERKPYKLELNPGWNLVSLPGQPADTDINAVIPADHPIDAVATYDPMTPGTWLTSLESGDGTFDGTVETIQAGLAYWIRTTSFQALEVDIPKPTPGATTTLLPTIQISQGWNLVPVLDVDGDFELATQMEDDNYFSGLTDGSVAAIYTYNTVTNSWASVSETGVELGKGYWVYATKPGVIVP